MDERRDAPGAQGQAAGSDERDSQLSAMFDGELADSECELLARRLSRDPVLQQQWSRYSLIGAVIRNEPLHARRAPGGRVAAGIAARLSSAIEAEAAVQPEVASLPEAGVATASATAAGAAGGARWMRPAAGVAIAAGVAALSVFWLQARGPEAPAQLAAAASVVDGPVVDGPVVDEVVAPALATRGTAAEIVVASNPGAAATARDAAVGRGAASGEPESYVVPMPTERTAMAAPAQLANYVVAHSEYSTPLSRRSLLSALVAADGGALPDAPQDPADAAPADAQPIAAPGGPAPAAAGAPAAEPAK